MPTAQEEELRAALRTLEPGIRDCEARMREAAATCPPGDPMLAALRRQLDMLQQEERRLREQLKKLSP
jgi:hypothetical protein